MLVEKFDVAAGFCGSHAAVGTTDAELRFALTVSSVVALGGRAGVFKLRLPTAPEKVPLVKAS
jgi:hypothetical protein